VKSKKSSLWRTCMIIQQLENKIAWTEGCREEIARLSELELRSLARPDDEEASFKIVGCVATPLLGARQLCRELFRKKRDRQIPLTPPIATDAFGPTRAHLQ
jgi:hypothetical protein